MNPKYKTELHCHTCTSSNCATDTPQHLLEAYVAHGYSTLVVTDHFNTNNLNSAAPQFRRYEGRFCSSLYDRSMVRRFDEGTMTWEDKVNHHLDGYRYLKEIAPEGLHILLGGEFQFPYLNTEFLVYGMTESFLYAHPDLDRMSLEPFVDLVHKENMLVFCAHPFRNWCNLVDPEDVDGIEVFNGAPNHQSRNDMAEYWADRYSLLKSSGTDYHYAAHTPNGGIETDEPITSVEQLVTVLSSRSYDLIQERFQDMQ